MKLRDVVDLEAQLARDEAEDDTSLRTRDRALYLEMTPQPGSAEGLLVAWLDALRTRFGAPVLGDRVALAQRVVAYLLAFSGFAMGWGVAVGLLHYEQGGTPVNVGHFLLVLVFGQLGLLALLGLGLLLRALWPRIPLFGDLTRLLRVATDFLARRLRAAASTQRFDSELAVLRRTRTRLGLYGQLEHNLLLGQSQLFAFAFNLGALASCLRLILLSDLAFAWSTSVATLDARQLHALCTALAWPFAWLVPDALPSRALIEHTQYFRLEGRFAGAAVGTRGDPLLAAAWWRFLVACTLCYGLLPRLFTLVLFTLRLRAAERAVPLDTPAVQRVLARLSTPVVSLNARALTEQGAEPAHAVVQAPVLAAASSALILYRDIPTEPALLQRALRTHLQLEISGVYRAGGLDVQADQALCTALGQGADAVALLAEAWEAPDKSLRHLLASLRTALGPRRALRVVLIGEAHAHGFHAAAPEDVRVYRDRLTLLDDPYLSLETLPASAPEENPREALS